ncbi:MAG TPA: DNA polymerase III subunit gamma/tau [Patescibacteria group bacterium]|nr:DNA polymerase III subunit gamma/tau [Patescibacteria group bacterium]
MARALYRTHRPQKLSEVVGQEHITTALDRALKKGTISHAYLFTGPRGVGKTSIARILAHEINGLPYEDDANHLDIIEIDAASNRRIDEIRDLRDKVHTAPASAKFKVYIIDEVHMLTKEAFNALLKTLEEPPAHVVFILATTEAHKLPETIISRTQRFAFKPVDLAKVTAHLKAIADKEKITIDDAALELIAAHGEGSFRDSISLLDQIRNTGEKITLADAQQLLGLAPKEYIEQLLDSLAAHDAPALINSLRKAAGQGYEPAQIAKQLAGTLREALLANKLPLQSTTLMKLLSALIDVPASANPRSYLEITLLDIALEGQQTPAKPKIMPEVMQSKAPVVTEPHPSSLRKSQPETEDQPAMPSSDAVIDMSAWPDILAAIKAKHNTLYSIIHTARPHFEPGVITLECQFAFHKKRLNEARNREVLSAIVKTVTGDEMIIKCVVSENGDSSSPVVTPTAQSAPKPAPSLAPTPTPVPIPAPPTDAANQAPQNETISAISNIFGSAEVLES